MRLSRSGAALYMVLVFLWGVGCATETIAQELGPVRPSEPEIGIDVSPTAPGPSVQRQPPQKEGAGGVRHVTDEDLKANPQLAAMILNQAMLQEDWAVLKHVMRFYPQMDSVDPILRDYVQGALYRHEGDYPRAIALYQGIVDQHSDLDYVRLELAIMLFENKQYRQADEHFIRARKGSMERGAHMNAQRYQLALEQQRRWKFSLQGGLAYNSNLNSANRDKDLYLPVNVPGVGPIWHPFAKRDEQFPKSAWGFKYQGRAYVERNVSGNHFYTLDADLNGVSYNNHSDYTDFGLNLAAGYKYQDLKRWLSVTLQVNKTWMGGEAYSHSHGVGLDFGYLPNRDWQLMASYLWLRRTYDDKDYALYNGNLRIASATAVRIWSPAFITFGGVGWQRESVTFGEYSSRFPWAQFGVIMNAGNALAGRFSVRYGKKRYDDPYSLFLRTKREDREWRFSTSLWKPGFKIAGMEPKLNFSYMRIKSNLPAYSRNRSEFSLMFEKTF